MARIPVRFAVPLALLGSGACDDSTTLVLEPNPAVRIVIDSSRCPTVDKCSFCVLETEAFDKNSNPAPLPTLIWSSANENIATVEARPGGEGRVNAWNTGVTVVTVEVLETGATDDTEVGVTPPSSPNIVCEPPGANESVPSPHGSVAS
ncbi:MAG TPA: hypothetical protein VJ982_04725 [Gemmatimonadota bacterium]|nr:hypothetical protein [Gemmatimonadota bacterium]